MTSENRMKMAVISGASLALEMKEKNPSAPSSEILKKISLDVSDILEKIDKSL